MKEEDWETYLKCPVCGGKLEKASIYWFKPFSKRITMRCACGCKMDISVPLKE